MDFGKTSKPALFKKEKALGKCNYEKNKLVFHWLTIFLLFKKWFLKLQILAEQSKILIIF